MAKQKMIVVAPCYVHERIWNPGETFDYEGPPSRAYHPIDGPPTLPPIDMDALTRITPKEKKAAAAVLAEDERKADEYGVEQTAEYGRKKK